MTRIVDFGRRLLLSVDAKGYGAADGRRQVEWQAALVEILDEAAASIGLRRQAWERQGTGDGELSLLPPDERENILIDNFPREVQRRLAAHNDDRDQEKWLRLRLAIHHGVAFPASNGYAGAGVVAVSRLVDCPPARRAQSALPKANVVVVLSNRVFLDTVAQRHTHLRPEELRRISVKVKEYIDDAWLYVPGFDATSLQIDDAESRGSTPRAGTLDGSTLPGPAQSSMLHNYSAEVINKFDAPVTAEVIGVKKMRIDG